MFDFSKDDNEEILTHIAKMISKREKNKTHPPDKKDKSAGPSLPDHLHLNQRTPDSSSS